MFSLLMRRCGAYGVRAMKNWGILLVLSVCIFGVIADDPRIMVKDGPDYGIADGSRTWSRVKRQRYEAM